MDMIVRIAEQCEVLLSYTKLDYMTIHCRFIRPLVCDAVESNQPKSRNLPGWHFYFGWNASLVS